MEATARDIRKETALWEDAVPLEERLSAVEAEERPNADDDEERRRESVLDAERLFASSVAQTRVLTREQETALTQEIVRARNRVRRVLRQTRRLCRLALADVGRGVVPPEQDFRERETVMILNYGQELLSKPGTPRGTGLRRSELRAFVKALSAALDDYRELRDEMVRANIRLVTMLARQYRHPTLTFLDFVQEGTIGLIRAIEKYEPSRKVKFSTYAVWWIWQQVARAADNYGSLIRTPVHWSQFRRRLSREEQDLSAEGSGETVHERLASRHGMDPERVAAMSQTFHYVSTDAPIGDDDDRPLETVVADEEAEPQEQAMQTDLRERLEVAIEQLPPREAEIIRHRFGLQDDQAQTLEEIGERFGVSRERIRQLENRALRQLREVCSAQGLHEYLN
jgi:RNA polymerase sigma factor (sigma-70 family)